jgi:molybdopterin-guanine dinucleotide biosynthesis protein A
MLRVGGIVLCGGQSKRMGTAKAWLPIADELMLPRVVRILSEVTTPIVVVAAVGQALPPLDAEVQIVRDEAEARGPLQGLAAGLAALTGRADAAFVASCDVPLLKPAFVQRMIDLLGEHSISVARVGGYYHPLAAVYRVEMLRNVRSLLDANHRRLVDLLEQVPTRVVEEADLRDVNATLESLRNVNTPDDLAQVLRDLHG